MVFHSLYDNLWWPHFFLCEVVYGECCRNPISDGTAFRPLVLCYCMLLTKVSETKAVYVCNFPSFISIHFVKCLAHRYLVFFLTNTTFLLTLLREVRSLLLVFVMIEYPSNGFSCCSLEVGFLKNEFP